VEGSVPKRPPFEKPTPQKTWRPAEPGCLGTLVEGGKNGFTKRVASRTLGCGWEEWPSIVTSRGLTDFEELICLLRDVINHQ